MDITQIISSTITKQLTKGISQKTNLPQKQTQSVLELAIPLLMGGLAKNSANPQGANNLLEALTKDHDGSILKNPSSAINKEETETDGEKILKHILGNKQASASQAIANQLNIDTNQVTQILSLIAPFVMGALGKKQKNSHLDSSSLSELLLSTMNQKTKSAQKTNLISAILDQNDDGSVVDEIANIGLKAIGGLFKKS